LLGLLALPGTHLAEHHGGQAFPTPMIRMSTSFMQPPRSARPEDHQHHGLTLPATSLTMYREHVRPPLSAADMPLHHAALSGRWASGHGQRRPAMPT